MINDPNLLEFKPRAIEPVECLKRGWDLIKDQYWLFMGMSLLGIVIGNLVPFGILLGPIMCGLNIAFLQRWRGETVEFGTLFKGFEQFVDGMVAALLHYVPMMIIIVPFYVFMVIAQIGLMAAMSTGGEPNPAAAIGLVSVYVIGILILVILLLLLSVGFVFTYPLIVDRKLSGVNAVKLSFKAAFANFWQILGLLLLNALVSFGGVLLCFVGVYLVLPVTFAALFVAYTQVFGVAPRLSPYPPPPPTFN